MEGVVKRVNNKKGYGFIDSQGKDYFVHRWDIQAKSELKEGDRVSFKVEKAPQDFKAISVRKISERSKK
jgi:CspA family cold shock protein